jgi:hypothetical protein
MVTTHIRSGNSANIMCNKAVFLARGSPGVCYVLHTDCCYRHLCTIGSQVGRNISAPSKILICCWNEALNDRFDFFSADSI